MKSTGRYCPVEDGFDLDEKINEVAKLTDNFIKELIEEVGIDDYKLIAKMIIETHSSKL